MLLWIALSMTVTLSVMATLAVVVLLRRPRRLSPMRGTNDVEGVYVTTIATLYAILMAFMIFAVWTRYYDALITVEAEADALGDIYRLAQGLPQPYRGLSQSACMQYAQYMISVEWPVIRRGTEIPRPPGILDALWASVIIAGRSKDSDNVLRDHLMSSIVQLTNLRRSRLLQARTGLPGVLYVVLVFGAVVTVGLSALFVTDDFRPHALKACVLAALISLTLFTIWALDYPYDGWESVSPDAFKRTVRILGKAQPTPRHPGPPNTQHASGSGRHHP